MQRPRGQNKQNTTKCTPTRNRVSGETETAPVEMKSLIGGEALGDDDVGNRKRYLSRPR
jgi:hypothetical protein